MELILPEPGTVRARILESAWALVLDRGLDFSMKEVADRSGVTRQAVYLQVGSRSGLFVAMARYHDAREGIGARFGAALDHPAREALVRTIRTWFDYLPSILPVARALQDAAARDEDAAAAWWDRMDSARLMMRRAVEQLAREGGLDDRWEIDDAADVLWSLTHPQAWEDLVGHRGWEPQSFVDRIVEIAELILVRPGRLA
jgi:AcrR family transcriptional regulator